MECLEEIQDGCAECFPFETIEELKRIPLVIREQGSGSLEVFEKALGTRQLKLSQLNIIMQLGTTEGIKRFLYNTDSVGIVSIQAVSSEIADGKLKVIEISDFDCERASFKIPVKPVVSNRISCAI